MRITQDVLGRIQTEIEDAMDSAFRDVRFCLESADDVTKDALRKAVELLTDVLPDVTDSYICNRIKDFLMEVKI